MKTILVIGILALAVPVQRVTAQEEPVRLGVAAGLAFQSAREYHHESWGPSARGWFDVAVTNVVAAHLGLLLMRFPHGGVPHGHVGNVPHEPNAPFDVQGLTVGFTLGRGTVRVPGMTAGLGLYHTNNDGVSRFINPGLFARVDYQVGIGRFKPVVSIAYHRMDGLGWFGESSFSAWPITLGLSF